MTGCINSIKIPHLFIFYSFYLKCCSLTVTVCPTSHTSVDLIPSFTLGTAQTISAKPSSATAI